MATTMPSTLTGEARMLIDGKLVGATDGALYDNLNPATVGYAG